MLILETLRKEHAELLKRVQLVEEASLLLYKEKSQLPREEYVNVINEFSQFFKTSIVYHFKVEEQALFPVLKDKDLGPDIQELLSEHRRILMGFQHFERIKGPIASVTILKMLINDLSIHARKEDELFPLWASRLSNEELKRIDEEAELIRLD